MAKKRRRRVSIKWSTRVVSDKMLAFNMRLAAYYNGLLSFKVERPLDRGHVNWLELSMRDGTFLTHQAVISIAVCAWDKKERKLNGQHIANARLQLGNGAKLPKVRVVKYNVRTEDEYRQLYICFDRSKSRTASHLAKMLIYGSSVYMDVPLKRIPTLTAGARWWWFGSKRVKIEEVCDAMCHDFPKVGKDVADVLEYIVIRAGTSRGLFLRQPVVAAIFETVQANSMIAREFWVTMVDGLFRTLTHPAKMLREFLLTTIIGHRVAVSNLASVSNIEMFNYCVGCFNAFHAGSTLTKAPNYKRADRLKAA